MQTRTAEETQITTDRVASIPADLLDGFRFRVCETAEDATRAIDLNGSLAAAEKEMRAAGVTLTEMAALA